MLDDDVCVIPLLLKSVFHLLSDFSLSLDFLFDSLKYVALGSWVLDFL